MPFDLATFLSTVVVAGGGAVAVVRLYGEKWLDNRFAAQLEKAKQAHATEIEHLKFRINALLDRTTKLNQREFEVLTDLWPKLCNAHNSTAALFIAQRRRDVSKLPMMQLEIAMQNDELTDFEKIEIRSTAPEHRSQKYFDVVESHRRNEAHKDAIEFITALNGGSIYMHPDTFQKIDEFATRLARAHMKLRSLDSGRSEPAEGDADEEYRKHGQEWLKTLGDYLRERYWSDGTASL